jgi:hypothetical protein
MSARISSARLVAGPSVATIFVCLIRSQRTLIATP